MHIEVNDALGTNPVLKMAHCMSPVQPPTALTDGFQDVQRGW
jgi:hypothetical protein